ncbi:MAG: O-antigen ligase family protein [Patescibacteria group bacterium]|nr:O-antigen ligase family protein [Patescibacteria group bacterium]
MSADNLFKKIISFFYIGLFFTVPLFFTLVNSELFEFNKIILTYGFTIVILGLWLGRMVIQKKIIFKKSPLDIPLVLFLFSQIISTIFSESPHTSLWGYYSRFNGGLLSTISYLLLYWAFVANCEKKDVFRVIYSSLASGLIVSLYGILEHFGHSFSCVLFLGKFDVSCWVQKVQERVFATLGQPNWLGAYLAVLIPMTLGLILNSKCNSSTPGRTQWYNPSLRARIQNLLPIVLSLIFYLCLIFTGSRSSYLGLIIGLFVFWLVSFLLNKKEIKNWFKFFLIFNFSLLTFNIFFGSPFPQINRFLYYKDFLPTLTSHSRPTSQLSIPTPTDGPATDGPALEVGGTESGKIRQIVWKGAFEIFKHYPIFGSGVETFAYSYYNFRPLEHNLVSEWDFLYNKAHNEYLNYLSTTGIFGLGSYLLIIVTFSVCIVKQLKSQKSKVKTEAQNLKVKIKNFLDLDYSFEFCTLSFALFSGWISILVSNFFGFSVVLISLYFYLIPAFIFVLVSDSATASPYPTSHPRPISHFSPSPINFGQKLGLLITLLLSAYLLYSLRQVWLADAHYANGQKLYRQNQYLSAYEEISKAIDLFPNEPVFLNDLSSVTAGLALLAGDQKEATMTTQLTKLAADYSKETIRQNPVNLNFVKARIKVLYTLSTLDQKYLNEAITVAQNGLKLAPTDPKLVYNLGLLYGKEGNTEKTIELIKKALELKPNYEEARSTLAAYLEGLGRKEEALQELNYLLKYKPNDPDLLQRIEKLK